MNNEEEEINPIVKVYGSIPWDRGHLLAISDQVNLTKEQALSLKEIANNLELYERILKKEIVKSQL